MVLEDFNNTVRAASEAILRDELVAFPTETVYGLGANAFSDAAVTKIFDVKKRPRTSPLIVHCHSFIQATELIDLSKLNEYYKALLNALAAKYWPGSLAIILPSNGRVSSLVSAGHSTIAIRVPSHPVALALINASAVPLAAPSANPHKYVSPTSAAHVREQIGNQIACVLDGGDCNIGVESTILSLVESPPTLMRHGAVTQEELEQIIPNLVVSKNYIIDSTQAQVSPGQLAQHYSPRTTTKFYASTELATLPEKEHIGILSFSSQSEINDVPHKVSVSVSKNGCATEIAQKLFAGLRELDSCGLKLILLDSVPEKGLGRAIMDRLRRATATATS
jgi:L-threonylcarbamoyladenylate synthase